MAPAALGHRIQWSPYAAARWFPLISSFSSSFFVVFMIDDEVFSF
jgi:hypothetical protein